MIVGRWAAGLSVLLAIDGAITAIWWGLEVNPVALRLGLGGVLLIHLLGVVWLVGVDQLWPEIYDHQASKIALGLCMVWYSVVTVSNIMVIYLA